MRSTVVEMMFRWCLCNIYDWKPYFQVLPFSTLKQDMLSDLCRGTGVVRHGKIEVVADGSSGENTPVYQQTTGPGAWPVRPTPKKASSPLFSPFMCIVFSYTVYLHLLIINDIKLNYIYSHAIRRRSGYNFHYLRWSTFQNILVKN